MANGDSSDDPVWYRLGYALERVRQTASGVPARIPSTPTQAAGSANPFVELGVGWLERQLTTRLVARSRDEMSGWSDVARAVVVGATVELALAGLRGLLASPTPASVEAGASSDDPVGELPFDALGIAARGAAHGMVFAGLIRPVLPGAAWIQGIEFGFLRYLASRGGGLASVLGGLSPHHRLPGLDGLMAGEEGEESLGATLAAGVTVALLYESLRSSASNSGIRPDAEGEYTS